MVLGMLYNMRQVEIDAHNMGIFGYDRLEGNAKIATNVD